MAGPDLSALNGHLSSSADEGGIDGEGHNVGDLRYEVMYMLAAPDDSIEAFKEVWAGIGDSIVVVGGDGLWNCHIHTNDVGAAIEVALDSGRPSRIRVTDLDEQVEEERWVREGVGAPGAGPSSEGSGPPPTTGVVAVVSGDGIGRIFRSLGVHHLVVGGQTMNPATADLVKAVEAVGSDQVVILPNNKNIRPVAEQVDALSDKTVQVVASGSIVEGFAALLAYDPGADLETNVAAMSESCARVVPAEVTRAVRDSTTDAGEVHEGDWIGISRDGVVSIADNIVVCTRLLLSRLLEDSHELVTLIEGEGAAWRTPGESSNGCRRSTPPWRSRSTRAASRSIRTCSVLSSGSHAGRPERHRGVAAPWHIGAAHQRCWASSGSKASSISSPRTRGATSTARARPTSPISSAGDEAAVLASVRSVSSRRSRQGRAMVELTVGDDTGKLHIVFFNQPWRAKQLESGSEAIFFGKVTEYRGPSPDGQPGRRRHRRGDAGPAHAPHPARVPGVGQGRADQLGDRVAGRRGPRASWRVRRPGTRGVAYLTRPVGTDRVLRDHSSPRIDGGHCAARRRLVFDELFRLQLALVLRRRAFEVNARALHHDVSPREVTGNVSDTLVARFLAGLPYELTTAQRRALAVIVADMAGPFPMHRLLQGDVGSGKTVVALAALLGAVQSGHQGAFMVPTEVLAEQHITAVRALLGDLEGPGGMAGGLVRVELLTSKVKGKARTAVLAGLASGDIGVVVGPTRC